LLLKRIALIKKFNEKLNDSVKSEDINQQRFSQQSKSCFLENEKIIKSFPAHYMLDITRLVEGSLILTEYRLIFTPKSLDLFEKEFILPQFFKVPFTYISAIIKKKESAYKLKYILKMQPRDRPMLTIHFGIKKDFNEAYNYILEMMSPKSVLSYFAFKYNAKYEKSCSDEHSCKSGDMKKQSDKIDDEKILEQARTSYKENGWNIYQQFLEYLRMGVDVEQQEGKFRLYIQEANGYICETYPNFLYIRKTSNDEELKKVAGFRSKKRFPALVWINKSNSASLWRSSQVKAGLVGQRSSYDEIFLKNLSHETEKLHIYDARPYINAFANKVKGLGYENPDNYKNCELYFCDIENIHAVKTAYNKIRIASQLPL
jgi:hypothetical protein